MPARKHDEDDVLREQFEFLLDHGADVRKRLLAMGVPRNPSLDEKGAVLTHGGVLAYACGCSLCNRYNQVRMMLLAGME
jgi:hypothetical protein